MDWGRDIEVNGVRPAWLKGIVTVDLRTSAGWGLSDYYTADNPAEEWAWSHDCGYANVLAIRLPADHWAYCALDAGFEPWGGGDAEPEGWDGGEVLFKNGGIYRGAYDWRHDNLPFTSFENIIGYRKHALPAVLDWSKPIEAVRKADGRVFPVTLLQGGDDCYVTECPDPSRTNSEWHADGRDFCSYDEWFVRNRAIPAAKQPEGDTVTIRRMTERAAHLRFGEEGMMAVRALGIIRPETPAERFARETGHEVTPAVEAALAWGKAA